MPVLRRRALRRELETLSAEWCAGAAEYRDCAVHSLQSQAMAKALLKLLHGADTTEVSTELLDALIAAQAVTAANV